MGSAILLYISLLLFDRAPWGTFLWVETFPIGFAPEALLPVLIGFVVSTVESIGDIKASCDASRLQIDCDRQLMAEVELTEPAQAGRGRGH